MNKRTLAKLGDRIAALEKDMAKEVEAFVEENKDVIPEWLLGWARGLSFKAVQTLVAELRKQGPGTKAARASASALPDADRRYMDKVFGNTNRPAEAITATSNGGLRSTHMTRAKGPSSPAVRAMKTAKASAAVHASALPPLPESDRAAMDRIFGNLSWPTDPARRDHLGRVSMTHLTRSST